VKCSFCGKSQDEVYKIVAGPGVCICDECIKVCNDIILDRRKKEDRPFDLKNVPHYKRIKSNNDGRLDKKGKKINKTREEIELEKSNILLIGPTGCGKTLLARTLAKKLNVPFVIADATTLTEAGYVGDDVENILLNLLRVTDNDIDLTQKGIIYIDEIDKIARKSENPSITNQRCVRRRSAAGSFKNYRRYGCKCTTLRRKKAPARKEYSGRHQGNIVYLWGNF